MMRSSEHDTSQTAAPAIRTPFIITQVLVGLNVLLFGIQVVTGVSPVTPTTEQLLNWGANFGPLTISGQWWRVITSTFLHIGFVHLLLNMWCLWNLGRLAEWLFGKWLFLLIYMACGCCASVASFAFNMGVVSAGASGAIFGITGALYLGLKIRKTVVPDHLIKKQLKNLAMFIIINLAFGFMIPGIDNFAHIGGFLTGLLFSWATIASSTRFSNEKKHLTVSVVATVLFTALLFFGAQKYANRNNILAHFQHGHKKLLQGKYEEAQKHFEYCLELNPDSWGAQLMLGDTFSGLKKYEKAIDMYKKCLHNDSIQSSFRVQTIGNMGWAYYCMDNYSESIRQSQRALSIDSTQIFAGYNLALAYLCVDSTEKAMTIYQNYYTLDVAEDGKAASGAIDDLNALARRKSAGSEGANRVLVEVFGLKGLQQ